MTGEERILPSPYSENNVTNEVGQRNFADTSAFLKTIPKNFGCHSLIHDITMASLLYLVLLPDKNVASTFISFAGMGLIIFSSENS